MPLQKESIDYICRVLYLNIYLIKIVKDQLMITKFTYYVVYVHMYIVANPERITESDSGDLAGLLNFH